MSLEGATVLAGNVTDAPELRYTPSGTPVASFTVAMNHRAPGRQGGWTDAGTSFVKVVAWRELAENLAESLPKGARVLVAGRLRQRSWETPEGERRSVIEVTAEDAGPSLRWAQAEPRKLDRRHEPVGARPSAGGQFNDEPPY
jgi:single-strand DNA-binding protein